MESTRMQRAGRRSAHRLGSFLVKARPKPLARLKMPRTPPEAPLQRTLLRTAAPRARRLGAIITECGCFALKRGEAPF